MRTLLPLLACCLAALPARAGDGVVEINQTCAVQTGCFPGDGPGFPVSIDGSAGRSYRLTSDLVTESSNATIILVGASGVRIDLGGFAIRGPVACSGTPPVCSPASGASPAITWTGSSPSNVSVTNGSISGVSRGISLLDSTEVSGVRVHGNAGNAITVGSGSIVSNCIVHQNLGSGIIAGNGALVADNVVHRNGVVGIQTTSGATVTGNTAYLNGSFGISASLGSTVAGNTAYDNAGAGIDVGAGSTVSSNAAYSNSGDGISTGSAVLVTGNNVRFNTGFGLNLGIQSGYRENVVSNNTAGTVNGTSLVNLGNNACNGSATCP